MRKHVSRFLPFLLALALLTAPPPWPWGRTCPACPRPA